MQDKELYEHLLGIEKPWSVSRIELDMVAKRVNIWVNHREGIRWSCPECQMELGVYDHAQERAWRHLDSCTFKTYLHARIPRVECSKDGILQVKVGWAEPQSRFTLLFERLAIDVLRQCDISGAGAILGISWKEAWHIMERAVARGKRRESPKPVRSIGVDEKAIAKGHKYMTIVCDLEQATVKYVAEERKQESLEQYYKGLSSEQKERIESVAMDMWEPYLQATLTHVPSAGEKIVYDRFHIMSHMGKAVDTVRRQEHRQRMAEGDEVLKGSKYLWLYNQENVPEHRRDEFAALRTLELKVRRAWALKETLRQLWDHPNEESAYPFWKRWYFWATHSRLKPVYEVAVMLKRHLTNVLSYFRYRITNAVSEGLNNKIQSIKKMAYGFRNSDHFKIAIYFHCGGLDLYPC